MSLSSAIQAAVSGLGASARRAETVASNVANASTTGYARRSLDIVVNAATPGVRVLETQRHVDRLILAETRLASAELGKRTVLADQLLRLEAAIGKAGEGDSISGVIDNLQSAIMAAAGDPSSETRLAGVADATSRLAQRFARASDALQGIRSEADRTIAADIRTLNVGLSRIAQLERQIVTLAATGRDTASLQDMKQREIDAISQIVPLKETPRQDGRSILSTLSGAVLFDGRAAVLSFEPTPVFSASTANGGVVRIDGIAASSGDGGMLAGGTLAAAFELRDRIVPGYQQDLDALAADLAQRIATSDGTLPPLSAGLLTDGGSPVDASNLTGLAGRLAANDAIDPAKGGALWRIRSGIAATDAGPPGNSSLLDALQAALSALPDTPSDRAGSLGERAAYARVSAERDLTVTRTRTQTLQGQLAEGGVNSDAELQELMQIEKSYAANARVLRAVDEMLASLLAR